MDSGVFSKRKEFSIPERSALPMLDIRQRQRTRAWTDYENKPNDFVFGKGFNEFAARGAWTFAAPKMDLVGGLRHDEQRMNEMSVGVCGKGGLDFEGVWGN
jgi:hypothetical protein